MTDSFAAANGRKVVSRTSAEELGKVTHIVVNVERRKVELLVVGKGRNARLVEWDDVSGFGPDAVMVADDSTLAAPHDDRGRAAADGQLDLLGKHALSDAGNDIGPVTDVVFDPATGAIETLVLRESEEPATSLLAAGSFAAVVRAPAD
jgi:sporulation protein YlmC with PRC-barrel domain